MFLVTGFSAMVHFTLYSRSYCHLCDELLEALQALSPEYSFTVEVVDVDSDEALLALYDDQVPVLFGSRDGAASVRLCHYFLDEPKVKAFLTNG
ncbi:glutaredoxin family protein [Noviherbaspirillum massiliense]|uniref:glutaredoxin family protein n=1 Tax=Noviherbaspirillum massiliense TaxID=1465823 RepID=UPI000374BB3C|nr:glutaredoxin family protein [Noviherbaspirillum massiliense]